MFFGKPRKKIKLIYSHRTAPTNVVKIVGLCESVKKEDTILRNLTLTLKVKPRLKKSHQTIFATRQKKTLPLLKKKKKKETGGKKKNQGHLYTKGNSQRTWSLQFFYTL